MSGPGVLTVDGSGFGGKHVFITGHATDPPR
jgi:hypothetical protein